MTVEQLTVNFDETPALWDLNFSVPSGKLVGIVGPNGAGKSTFLKAALEIIKPLSGRVLFLGQPLKSCRQKIAYVPQRSSVDWHFPITSLELVLMGRYKKLGLFKWPARADWDAARNALDMVGMLSFAHRQINQLSGGQQQRLFIARALLQDPVIYFMDEPFAGVDISTQKTILELLQKMRGEGKTVFVVHHDLSTVERYFDWVVLLNTSLVAQGPVEEVFTPANVMRAFGGSTQLLEEAARLSQEKMKGMAKDE